MTFEPARQSWTDKDHPRTVRGDGKWYSARWIIPELGVDTGKMPMPESWRGHDVDFDLAIFCKRVAGRGRLWLRLMRYPTRDSTHWVGPIRFAGSNVADGDGELGVLLSARNWIDDGSTPGKPAITHMGLDYRVYGGSLEIDQAMLKARPIG